MTRTIWANAAGGAVNLVLLLAVAHWIGDGQALRTLLVGGLLVLLASLHFWKRGTYDAATSWLLRAVVQAAVAVGILHQQCGGLAWASLAQTCPAPKLDFMLMLSVMVGCGAITCFGGAMRRVVLGAVVVPELDPDA
ncbi:hypothetical protein [Roseateles chitosanitabidus]|jgi:hypothetical protein|uniref:hypothetical protein n=1 Tax=Roseateles chitosanitabidus TaxID=65048 RepID=UPI000832DCA6|nr:hypothetical protein [Roseateles chitosanitabidus]MBO9686002.1 hypothetical protein [Roseateles chitosanitabidus]